MIHLAIMASGNGSNAKALIEKARELNNILIKVILTDKKNSGVIELGNRFNIPVHVIEKNNLSTLQHEEKILNVMRSFAVEWIFMAGYMRLLSSHFIEQFKQDQVTRIINIHPSLLPAYKGLHAFERAFADQVDSGITVHFVNQQMDGGDIIMQKSFKRKINDELADFIARGKIIEHQIYPKVLEELNNNQLLKATSICV